MGNNLYYPIISIDSGKSFSTYNTYAQKNDISLYKGSTKINQFAIGYMIKPSIHIHKVFREQVEKCLGATFNENKIEIMRDVHKTNWTPIYEVTDTSFFSQNISPPKCLDQCKKYSNKP